jgi:hypothetical protein
VYKALRLLLASIDNSSQIDIACKRATTLLDGLALSNLTHRFRGSADERIVNVGFYIVGFFCVMGVLGVDIGALIIALSGLVVSFAFMIGSASSKYLEVRHVHVWSNL